MPIDPVDRCVVPEPVAHACAHERRHVRQLAYECAHRIGRDTELLRRVRDRRAGLAAHNANELDLRGRERR
jgi:hypothetical protein